MSGLPVWDAAVPALALLAAAAGAAKVARPADTARALRAAGLPVGASLVRAGAGAEATVGVAVLAGAGRPALALLAASYLGFGVFVSMALIRRWPLASCGCFGEPDTPPTALHAAVCLVGAGVLAVAAASAPAAGVADAAAAEGAGRGAVFLVSSVAAAYVLYLVMASAPRLVAARAALRHTAPGGVDG
ncbi:MAG TPA: MauE/DoxX family redox-associated membrane protein [Acidimicrobiales bacterium]|nr:MauE/DoxX family redox-associated membrane protein [Acidimicrobiales bacterium]